MKSDRVFQSRKEEKMENKKISEKLSKYLKLSTPPVAAKMCTSKGQLPPGTKIPSKQWGVDFRACQAVHVARRYETTVAVPAEEMPCPSGGVALGFYKANKVYYSGIYLSPKEMSHKAKKVWARNVPKLPGGKYKYFLAAPLDQASFKPDVILVYGNPGQVSKLIQAAALKTGEFLEGRTIVGTACSEWMSAAMNTQKCQYVFPCDGERRYSSLDDSEMVFAIPYKKIGEILQGLEVAYYSKDRRRYPTQRYMIHEAPMPERYAKLLASLKKDAGMAP